ncbi:unnamed protein product [Meloidogyne enterolobii]|uniref:Uncharacterized protein n=1 Tax=Meloidogyne enterolobii TaxID=390850 RepID=A0ACB1A808_MELEN
MAVLFGNVLGEVMGSLKADGLGSGMKCLVGGWDWDGCLPFSNQAGLIFLKFLQLKDKISEDDKKVLDKCQETLSWLDANQTAEKEEFEHHQKELEAICNLIISKLYQSAGCAGMPGGMPGGML